MGGGNGMKSKTKRDRNQAKNAKGKKGSQLKSNTQALNITCKICRASFMCTMTEGNLMEHCDNKHPKKSPGECFDKLVAAGPSK